MKLTSASKVKVLMRKVFQNEVSKNWNSIVERKKKKTLLVLGGEGKSCSKIAKSIRIVWLDT